MIDGYYRRVMTARFVPPFPPRNSHAAPVWAGFFGERARNAIYGWSQDAFSSWHIRRRVLRFVVHIPLRPEAVQRVLLDNAANYVKPDIVKRLIAPMIGRGLLSADGTLWREQRRIVAASFAPAAVEALLPAFDAAARERMRAWRPESVRDMAEEATATTMTVITDTLFGGDRRLKTAAAMRHIAAALKAAGETRLQAIIGLPVIEWNRTMREGRRGQEFLRTTLADVVRERIRAPAGDDFLDRLIRALRERLPDEALPLAVDNAATFYLAGHETTANAVTWTLYLLSEQQELQARAAAEAQANAGPAGDDLPERLPILHRILSEALRLYPPVPRFDRQALGPDRLGDVEIAAGDIVSIWPWLIHRHKRLWSDPDVFDPDRFLPDRKAGYHRFQYFPFGAGPRVCVGARFATLEALTLLVRWLAAWRFDRAPDSRVEAVGSVTLRPKNGLKLRLSPR